LAKPVSYGTLYWQFNDAWPAISWSSIDYYGRWKPLQYRAKILFSDIILFYNPKNKVVTAINDKLIPIEAYYIM
jgi:beta-mannosidase